MSVLVSKRRQSRFEAIDYAIDIHDMLVEFIFRNFGVKDLDHLVRVRYAHGKDQVEDFQRYYSLMATYKTRVESIASQLTNNVRGANAIHPVTMREYEQRRDYQNYALVNCVELKKELGRIVDIFEVNVNCYGRYIKAIDREIDLIKRWRQKDNKIKSYLEGNV